MESILVRRGVRTREGDEFQRTGAIVSITAMTCISIITLKIRMGLANFRACSQANPHNNCMFRVLHCSKPHRMSKILPEELFTIKTASNTKVIMVVGI